METREGGGWKCEVKGGEGGGEGEFGAVEPSQPRV
jgi:hypothetical protein